MSDITKLEKALELHFAKFQPVQMADFRLVGPTRLYLEYDESGQYTEYHVANGNIVETGVLERPERDTERSAA